MGKNKEIILNEEGFKVPFSGGDWKDYGIVTMGSGFYDFEDFFELLSDFDKGLFRRSKLDQQGFFDEYLLEEDVDDDEDSILFCLRPLDMGLFFEMALDVSKEAFFWEILTGHKKFWTIYPRGLFSDICQYEGSYEIAAEDSIYSQPTVYGLPSDL